MTTSHMKVVGENMYITDSEINTDIENFVSLIIEAKEETNPLQFYEHQIFLL